MDVRIAALGLVILAACGGANAIGSAGGSCYADGSCDPGLACEAGTCVHATTDGAATDSTVASDSGIAQDSTIGPDASTDAGAGSDAGGTDPGIPPNGNCLVNDVDTGTYTYTFTAATSQPTGTNLDGFDNSNSVGGCGATDGAGGTDNGFEDFANALSAMYMANLDTVFSSGSGTSANTIRLRITHVRGDIASTHSDSCVAVAVEASSTGGGNTSVSGYGAITNLRLRGRLNSAVRFVFPQVAFTYSNLPLTILHPELDVTLNAPFTAVNSGGIIGYVFYGPTSNDTASGRDYSGFEAFKNAIATAGGPGAAGIQTLAASKTDLFMQTDGSLGSCGPNVTPNAFATRLGFTATAP